MRNGRKVAKAHLTHLNPFPRNLGEVLRRYPRVLVPEMNLGQLSRLVRAEFLVDAQSVTKVRGVPFTAGELEAAILDERSEATPMTDLHPGDHPQGLDERPGGAVVPRLR